LFNIHTKKWNAESLELLQITSDKLSQPVAVTHCEKNLLPAYQSFWGNGNIPFVIGASDGCLANLGCGAISGKEAAITIGTSGAVRIAASKPFIHPKGKTFSYILTDEIYINGGPTNNGGNVLQWLANIFYENDSAENLQKIISLAANENSNAGELIFLPYLYGERAPVWNAHARGIFFGLSALHGKSSFGKKPQ